MTERITRENQATIFVIFGITGDLAGRKLLPALFDLFRKNLLPEKFLIIGFAHSDFDTDSFRAFVSRKEPFSAAEESLRREFLSRLRYRRGDFDEHEDYGSLTEDVIAADRELGGCARKLFYLSVSPRFYEKLLRNLASSGLAVHCARMPEQTAVLIEKPFGKDPLQAQKLDTLLGKLFKEEQIFRIDHYLAKETLQNILTFRFANLIFEPLWSRHFIEEIQIALYEDIDIGRRGDFYDSMGALRDVGQNHILQMLALTVMDKPADLSAEAIRHQRAQILRALRPPRPEEVFFACYRGYSDTPGVRPNSRTETFFRLRTELDLSHWRGVPITLSAGKALAEKNAFIRVIFRPLENCLCPGKTSSRNVLTFRVQPREGISVEFLARKPSLRNEIVARELSFDYGESREKIDAYEKVLFDCIRGDRTLFASTEEVAAGWKFVAPLLENSSAHRKLFIYEKGADPEKFPQNQSLAGK